MTNSADGMEVPFVGVYREVEEPEKLVFAVLDAGDPEAKDSDEVVSVGFAERGGKTEMKFRHVGVAAEYFEETKAGWDSFFDALADYLAKR